LDGQIIQDADGQEVHILKMRNVLLLKLYYSLGDTKNGMEIGLMHLKNGQQNYEPS
jgi:hypothetical protein